MPGLALFGAEAEEEDLGETHPSYTRPHPPQPLYDFPLSVSPPPRIGLQLPTKLKSEHGRLLVALVPGARHPRQPPPPAWPPRRPNPTQHALSKRRHICHAPRLAYGPACCPPRGGRGRPELNFFRPPPQGTGRLQHRRQPLRASRGGPTLKESGGTPQGRQHSTGHWRWQPDQ